VTTSDRTEADPVVDYLERTSDELLATTHRLLDSDTQNPPGNTRAIAEWLQSELEGLGCDCECFCVDPEKPNVVTTLPGRSDFTLLYNGHLDTVPFQTAEWSYDPLGEVVDDRLYGRGATDMKGAVGAMLHVARAYARTGNYPTDNNPVRVRERRRGCR
jgi:succinyl-diaminopimelate desuccinylase